MKHARDQLSCAKTLTMGVDPVQKNWVDNQQNDKGKIN